MQSIIITPLFLPTSNWLCFCLSTVKKNRAQPRFCTHLANKAVCDVASVWRYQYDQELLWLSRTKPGKASVKCYVTGWCLGVNALMVEPQLCSGRSPKNYRKNCNVRWLYICLHCAEKNHVEDRAWYNVSLSRTADSAKGCSVQRFRLVLKGSLSIRLHRSR